MNPDDTNNNNDKKAALGLGQAPDDASVAQGSGNFGGQDDTSANTLGNQGYSSDQTSEESITGGSEEPFSQPPAQSEEQSGIAADITGGQEPSFSEVEESGQVGMPEKTQGTELPPMPGAEESSEEDQGGGFTGGGVAGEV